MLKSERLILKKPELEDVDKILKIQNSEFVQRYNMMKIYDKDDMIKEIVEEGKNTYYLQLIDAKEIIGAIFIGKDYFRHHVDSVCLSYYLDERYQRNGYMYESLKKYLNDLSSNKNIDKYKEEIIKFSEIMRYCIEKGKSGNRE